ncbi:hypothetical protein A2U01_0083205, partial [Trifolium medium]|nr:hypothetical protein [Trifolium medium]
MNTEANAGISHSNKDDNSNSQAQTLDPALLQPLNVDYPPQISDIPPVTSDSDIDTIA